VLYCCHFPGIFATLPRKTVFPGVPVLFCCNTFAAKSHAMKPHTLLFGLLLLAKAGLPQNVPDSAKRKLPLVLGIQFHTLALPFSDLRSLPDDAGVRAGTEVSLNKRGTLLHAASLSWYHSANTGDALAVLAQAVYRPQIYRKLYAEIRAGAGLMQAFYPSEAYSVRNGAWSPEGRTGKLMAVLPFGAGAGLNGSARRFSFSPFLSYEIQAALNYNRTLPAVPHGVLIFGSKIRF
jgi:hypothetical protein